jgi:hypothetical protein
LYNVASKGGGEMAASQDDLRLALLKIGLQNFYVETTYDGIIHGEVYRIVLSKEDADKLIQGEQKNGTEQGSKK